MFFARIKTPGIAHVAYVFGDRGEAAVVDPRRDVAEYLRVARENKLTLKYVVETHRQEDFVLGSAELARITGAKVVNGHHALFGRGDVRLKDGEEIGIAGCRLRALHTPGHTPESMCYAVFVPDAQERAWGVFTGDTLFIGDVGRPDLAVKSDLTEEQLAGHLYDSLRNKIMPLADDVIVYPAHGAGSACGKNMSKETTDLLGNQKKNNYALRADMSKEEFVAEVTAGLLPPPGYFPMNVKMNREGSANIEQVLSQGQQALSPEAFDAAANETGAVVLDTRQAETFARGFIPNSINIGIDGNFAPWVGALIPDIQQPILLVTDEGREEEVVTRLARVGFDHAIGYLKGGIQSWLEAGKQVDTIRSISAEEFASR